MMRQILQKNHQFEKKLHIKVTWPSNLKIWCKCAFLHAGERPSYLT